MSPTSRILLERLLTKWDYEVVVASEGEEAWRVLQAEDAPLLAILDWVMPGYNGVDVCRMARQRAGGERTYIILLTGRDSKDDIVCGLEIGSERFYWQAFPS